VANGEERRAGLNMATGAAVGIASGRQQGFAADTLTMGGSSSSWWEMAAGESRGEPSLLFKAFPG